VLSLILRLALLRFESGDYRAFLGPWYDFFVEHGRWHGLGLMTVDVANQSPLYLSLLSLSTLLPLSKLHAIKFLSIAGDYLAAWYVWRLTLLSCPGDRRQARTAVLVFLFLPTVVVNSALWGQCDIMYTSGFIASLYYVLNKRPVAALVAFGLSCSLKPQAVFFAPLLAGLFVSRRLPWKWLWIPAAVYAACGVPSILAGRPALQVLGHWALVRNQPGLTLHAPNWYQWVSSDESALLRGLGIALAAAASGVQVWWMSRRPPARSGEPQWLARAALLSVLLLPFLLPGMHERYFYPADVLAVIYAATTASGWVVVALMQLASGLAYCPFLSISEPVPETVLPFAVVLAIEWVLFMAWQARGRPSPAKPI
jgi:Gpi18-like mannosyltransferase